jgi:hypothetical protein
MTIAQYIQSGPTKANELFARLAETGSGAVKTRERVFAELKTELELHARLERDHLVPALRKHSETKDLIPGLAEDTKHVVALLAEIDQAPKDGDDFLIRIDALKRVFQQHVRDDRKELLPAVQKALSREETIAVAEAIETDKDEVEAARRAEVEDRKVQERQLRQAADVSRKAIDDAERAMQSTAAAVLRASQGSAREMGQAAQQAGMSLGAAADYGAAVTEGFRDGSQAWMSWAQDSVRLNLEGWQALMGCRTAPAAAAVQGRMVQDQVNLLLLGSRRISEAGTRTAKAAMQTIADRAEAAAEPPRA